MANSTRLDALSASIADRLRATLGNRLPDEAIPAFADALTAEHLRLAPEQPRVVDPSLSERGVVYTIHDSDLKLIDESASLAIALWTVTSNPVGVLAKLVALLYRLRRKRHRLEGEAALALLALRDAPERGWTVAEVRDQLERAYKVALPEDRVRVLLESLKDVRLPDNIRTDFADEHHGRWFAVDV